MPLPGGMTPVGLGITFSARDLASGPIGAVHRNFGRLHQSVRQGVPRIMAGFAALAGGMASLGTGIGVFRQSFGFAKQAGEFEIEMAGVRAVTQATERQFQALGESAVDAALKTQFGPAQAARGLRTLAQQGLIAADAIGALGTTLNFATAGSIEVHESAEILMGTLNAYGWTVERIGHLSDRLMRGTQLSALSANEFITVIGRAASAASLFNQGLDDMIIGLGSVRSAGIPATVATTAYQEALRRVATDAESRAEIERRIGHSIVTSTGKYQSLLEIVREYGDAISHLSRAEQSRLVAQTFHVRGMRAFNALANIQARVQAGGSVTTLRGAQAVAHYRRELERADGTTEHFVNLRLATFQGQMDLLAGALQGFAVALGEVFGPIFRPAVEMVSGLVTGFVRLFRSIPLGFRVFLGIVTLLGGGLLIFGGALFTVVGTVVIAVAVLGELIVIIGGICAAIGLAMAPVAAFGAAAAGLGYLIYRAWKDNLGGLADWFRGWTHMVGLAWQGLVQVFRQGYFSGEVMAELRRARGVRSFILHIWGLSRRLIEVWRGFRPAFGVLWKSLGPVFRELRDVFYSLAVEVARAFGSGPSSLVKGANRIPLSTYRELGVILAVYVGGGLRMVVKGLSHAMRMMRAWVRLWLWVKDICRPVVEFLANKLNILIGIFRIIYSIISAIIKQVSALLSSGLFGKLIKLVQLVPAINLASVGAGLALGGARRAGQGAGQYLFQDRPQAKSSSEVMARLGQVLAQQQSDRRTESARDYPGTRSKADPVASAVTALTEQVRASSRRSRAVELRSTLELDGRALAQGLSRTMAREAALSGNINILPDD